MTVDGCIHTFEVLASRVMPEHFSRLERAIERPLPATQLVGFKTASCAALQAVGREGDFPGCYVFLDAGKPVYVGISRGVVKRLVQHLNYDSHYSASLVS